MKKIVLRISLFSFLMTFISCHSGYSPSAVATSFLKAFEQKEFDEAKKYCTPETVKLVEIAESLSKMSTAKVEFAGKKYEVLSQEINGERAVVKFKEKDNDEVQSMVLKNVKGQWLVSISKEDIMAKQNADKFSDEEKENPLDDSLKIN